MVIPIVPPRALVEARMVLAVPLLVINKNSI